DFITIACVALGHVWHLQFSTAALGTNLVPGTYTNTERASFASNGHPGLDVFGDGRGTNESAGNFTIAALNIDYSGASPAVVSLSISFWQTTQVAGGPGLCGTINYNYAPAGPAVTDTIIENAAEGTDTVKSYVSYTLATNLENLT